MEPANEWNSVAGMPLKQPVIMESLHELVLPLNRHAGANLVQPVRKSRTFFPLLSMKIDI